MKLTLEIAAKLIDLTIERGQALGFKPLTVAVLDSGGNLKAFKRGDAPGLLRGDLAIGKAWSALSLGCGTGTFSEIARTSPDHINSLVVISGGRLVPNRGGLLLTDYAGDILGAIGVSGDSPDNDEAAALHSAEILGIVADPGTRRVDEGEA